MARRTSGSGGRRRREEGTGELFAKQLAEVVKEAFVEPAAEPALRAAVEMPLERADAGSAIAPDTAIEADAGSAIAPDTAIEADVFPAPADAASTLAESLAKTLPLPEQAAPPLEPLPARMLNEFVYCPRLFYYEHVEGVFVESADTVRGAAIHARVDQGSGAMPAAANGETKAAPPPAAEGEAAAAVEAAPAKLKPEPELIHSRSVTLGSERLGVIAKLDLVESRRVAASGNSTPSDDVAEGTSTSTSNGEAKAADDADLLARLDVQPVDYKAGAPRPGDDGNELWPTDKMQLGLQMLLLRDNGYHCDRGLIYYRSTRQRVPLELTPELEAWIVAQIADARRTMAGPIPPPLVGSPKCVRCSLAPVCLPDETRLLATGIAENLDAEIATEHAGASVENRAAFNPQLSAQLGPFAEPRPATPPPRRLITPRDDKRVLFLNKPGLRVGRKDEVLTVKEEQKLLEEVRIGDLAHVALFGNIQISTQAVQVLCEKEVPVTYFSMGGWFYGMTRGHELKNVFTRIEQFRLARDPAVCLALARRMVHGKVRNHRVMLMRLHLEPPAPIVAKLKTMADSALTAQSLAELLGTEGAAAHFYFSAFAGMLKAEDEFTDSDRLPGPQLRFNFNGRNRRPPTDPVNALLSLAYSLLAKDCTLAALAVGLDPYIGFYHQPRFGRPALALDVMEEFRPLIAESAVLTAINNRMILPRHFVQAGQAVNLTPAGRKLFFQAYEQRMNALITHPIFDYKVSYRRVVELQFRLLARYLTGEIPEYPPFQTR